jgi:hypothetical protein
MLEKRRRRSPLGRRNNDVVPPPPSVIHEQKVIGVKGLWSLRDGYAALDTTSNTARNRS